MEQGTRNSRSSRNIARACITSLLFAVSGINAAPSSIIFATPDWRPSVRPYFSDIFGTGATLPVGLTKDPFGNLVESWLPPQLSSANDLKFGDLTNAGCDDAVTEFYENYALNASNALPAIPARPAQLFKNMGAGLFLEVPYFPTTPAAMSAYTTKSTAGGTETSIGVVSTQSFHAGQGEGVVIADFNGDGLLDLYIPYYTIKYVDSPSPILRSDKSHLLINRGAGKFEDVTDRACASNSKFCPAFSKALGAQPEGVQAVDFNDDGKIDLLVAGTLFINTGNTPDGIPQFSACAQPTDGAQYGGNANCGLPGPGITLDDFNQKKWEEARADEGLKAFDYLNDGKLHLVLHKWNQGPKIFKNIGTNTSPNFQSIAFSVVDANNNVASPSFSSSFGIAAADLDGDGLEDIVTASDQNYPATGNAPARIFKNLGNGSFLVNESTLSQSRIPINGMAFGNISTSDRLDLVSDKQIFRNMSQKIGGGTFVVDLRGSNGQRNQQGRVIRAWPGTSLTPVAGKTMTRSVDGGAGGGYHAQSQYPVFFSAPTAGTHTVQISYPGFSKTFTIQTGQSARVLAPSASAPAGQVSVFSGVLPPIVGACSVDNSWVPLLNID